MTCSNNTDGTDWCLHPPTPCDSLGVNIIEIFLSLVGGGGTLPTAPLLPVNSPQVLQSVILGQDEDYCVVSIPEMSTVRPDLTPSLVSPAAGVDWYGGRLVHNHQVLSLANDLYLLR